MCSVDLTYRLLDRNYYVIIYSTGFHHKPLTVLRILTSRGFPWRFQTHHCSRWRSWWWLWWRIITNYIDTAEWVTFASRPWFDFSWRCRLNEPFFSRFWPASVCCKLTSAQYVRWFKVYAVQHIVCLYCTTRNIFMQQYCTSSHCTINVPVSMLQSICVRPFLEPTCIFYR